MLFTKLKQIKNIFWISCDFFNVPTKCMLHNGYEMFVCCHLELKTESHFRFELNAF